MPTRSKYGGWPRSGEIDLLESRGNLNLVDWQGNQIGTQQVSSTLHFGPRWDQNGYNTASYTRNNVTGYNNDFHKYELIWTESGIQFLVDGTVIGFVANEHGFWERGRFVGQNIWSSGSKMAPFDDEVRCCCCCSYLKFHLILIFVLFFSVSFHHKFGCWWNEWILPRSGQLSPI